MAVDFDTIHPNEVTLTPDAIIEHYSRAFYGVHQQSPDACYLGNGWYQINGEIVHRITLFLEIGRLRELETERKRVAKSSIVKRLIGKLRGL